MLKKEYKKGVRHRQFEARSCAAAHGAAAGSKSAHAVPRVVPASAAACTQASSSLASHLDIRLLPAL